jgi:hypothetical protein
VGIFKQEIGEGSFRILLFEGRRGNPMRRISTNSILASLPEGPKSNLSAIQTQADQLTSQFLDQATDWKSLAALTAGGLAYRLGKISILNVGMIRESPLLARPLSVAFSLGSEVTTFEFTNRVLQSVGAWYPRPQSDIENPPLQNQSPNLWTWSGPQGWKQGWLSSFVTFGTLKGFGKLAEAENLLLQHGAQDLGMVLGHQLLASSGLSERSEDTLAEQLLHAEATNLQIASGMVLGHALTEGKFLALERGMDLIFNKGRANGHSPLQIPNLLMATVGDKASIKVGDILPGSPRNIKINPDLHLSSSEGNGPGSPFDPSRFSERLTQLAKHLVETLHQNWPSGAEPAETFSHLAFVLKTFGRDQLADAALQHAFAALQGLPFIHNPQKRERVREAFVLIARRGKGDWSAEFPENTPTLQRIREAAREGKWEEALEHALSLPISEKAQALAYLAKLTKEKGPIRQSKLNVSGFESELFKEAKRIGVLMEEAPNRYKLTLDASLMYSQVGFVMKCLHKDQEARKFFQIAKEILEEVRRNPSPYIKDIAIKNIVERETQWVEEEIRKAEEGTLDSNGDPREKELREMAQKGQWDETVESLIGMDCDSKARLLAYLAKLFLEKADLENIKSPVPFQKEITEVKVQTLPGDPETTPKLPEWVDEARKGSLGALQALELEAEKGSDTAMWALVGLAEEENETLAPEALRLLFLLQRKLGSPVDIILQELNARKLMEQARLGKPASILAMKTLKEKGHVQAIEAWKDLNVEILHLPPDPNATELQWEAGDYYIGVPGGRKVRLPRAEGQRVLLMNKNALWAPPGFNPPMLVIERLAEGFKILGNVGDCGVKAFSSSVLQDGDEIRLENLTLKIGKVDRFGLLEVD